MNRLEVKRDLTQTLRRLLGTAAGISGYLSTRLTAAMVTLVLLTATTVGLLTYRNVEALVLPRALDRIDTHARLLAAELEASVRGARADVIGFRSAVAVDGIVRASLAGGVDSRDGMSVKQWSDRLALRFVAELGVKPNYLQFCIIGLADGGREILRVDRATPDGAIRIVPDAELQRRGDQDYFARTIALPFGGVDISQVELNQEHGAIDGPRVPVVRAATPIHSQDGRPFGMVIINVDLRAAFARMRSAARQQGRVFVVNERGDYLVHPDPKHEFGFDLGKPVRVQDDFPELADALANGEIEPRVVQDASGRRFGIALASVRLAGGPRVTVIEAVPHSQIMVAATAARDASLLAGFLAVLGAMALALLLARSLARPLVQMARAVESFGRNGWSLMVPAATGGEIGVLARAFRRMAGEVREKATALQQEIEERSRLFDTSPDLILVTDRQGNFIRVNPASKAILGYAPREMIGHSALRFIHPEDLESTREEMRAARRGRLTRNFETRYFHKDGRAVTLAWSGVWSEAEQKHFFIGRDRTEQTLAEEALRESEARLAAAQRIASVGHWERDLETDQITWSEETHRIFGLPREERFLSIAQFTQLLHPEDRRSVLEAQEQARCGGARYDVEYRVVRPGGEVRFVHSQADVITDESGRPLRMFGAVQDITERKRAEEALLESERMAHGIIDTALDALVQMDEAGIIVEWNPQAENILGWSRAEAVGQALASLIVPPAHREQHKAGLSRFLQTGESAILGKRFEIEALRRDGKQIEVELTVTALRRRHGYMFNGFIRDVTQRIKLEQQLRQSQKMEAVGQLTGGIAHDFNNLLTVILGNLELLDRKLTDDAARSLSSETRDAAEMGARLTDRLLTIARQQRLETRRINLNDFILNLSEFLRRTIGPTIGLSTSLSNSLWPTMADPGQIESAVLNLAINARDAMPKGGKLAIQTMNVTLDAEAVANIPGLAQGDYVVLSVSDTGLGMTAEVRARAFEPFFTTKGMEKGSGLGLATIYGFARQSGGNVTIYSELGQGTTVKLYLPRATEGQIEVNAAPATATEHLGRGETVLVVEDNEHVRRLTVMRLVDLGYRVLDVADANRALEALSSRPDVDMVFSDLVMPGGLSGLDLARRVKELHPKAKIVLTSGYSAALMHDEAIELLELQILRKPYRQSELARVFRAVLNAP